MDVLNKENVVKLLETSDQAVGRALSALLKRQTDVERATATTREYNGKGFTGVDAEFGTSVAEFFNRNGYITPKQAQAWRRKNKNGVMRIGKYAGQLVLVAQEAGWQPKAKATTIEPTASTTTEAHPQAVESAIRQFERDRARVAEMAAIEEQVRKDLQANLAFADRSQEKAEFARREQEQENAAYEAEMRRDDMLAALAGRKVRF